MKIHFCIFFFFYIHTSWLKGVALRVNGSGISWMSIKSQFKATAYAIGFNVKHHFPKKKKK